MTKCVLTDDERAALRSVARMLRANLTEHTPPMQRHAISWAEKIIRQLLARSGQGRPND